MTKQIDRSGVAQLKSSKTVDKTKSNNSPRTFPHLKKNLIIKSPRDNHQSKPSKLTSSQRQTVQSQLKSSLQSKVGLTLNDKTANNILEETELNMVANTEKKSLKDKGGVNVKEELD